MRRPGLVVARDPGSLLRQAASHDPFEVWLPPSVSEAEALEVLDPNWSIAAVRQFADDVDVALTATGTVTQEHDAAGLGFLRFGTNNARVNHASPSLAKLSDHGQVTCYLVGSFGGSGTTYLNVSHYYSAQNNQAMTCLIRNGAGVSAGMATWVTPSAAADYSGGSVAVDTRMLATLAWDLDAETMEAFADGVSSNGATATALSPGAANSFNNVVYQAFGVVSADATISYCLWAAGPRSAAIEAEIMARFASGEDMS